MGVRGPVPKRSEERLGNRAKDDGIEKIPRDLPEVKRPAPDPEWHTLAKSWYLSLGHSGQSEFYEPSDWTTALLLADQMSKYLMPRFVGIDQQTGSPIIIEAPMSGSEIQAFLKGMTSLLATEGDRRRAALELGRRKGEEEEDATVLHLVRDEVESAFG